MIVYEYPFNERIRTLLRLEDLYEKFNFFLHQSDPLQHHVALATIFEMLEVAGRADLKSDLLQELERQKHTLISFKSNPNVQAEMLDKVLDEVDQASSALIACTGKTGQHIRENEWLMSIRGRTIIPGGACEFDLPSYHAWQQNPPEKRFADISAWFAPIAPLFTAISVVLRLLRESGTTSKVIAQTGSYQQMLQGKVYQLLRVNIPQELGAIPEISANKYMLWIRYMNQDGDMKPKASEHDIPFDLTLCNF
ncbi:cell division protein ZapD [Undibacterium rugosum]|uniref:Cell division protein ZapD n=1 Tax=Undibacterium rugosum TaxID=2762291 RepID=A0A923I2B6_9BURK|nr:cell division protein ZapD [Undibacterium rugosum]MBC3935202.1 cell division protein ZapD [Undibacterium rugosum]MBR7777796.1 cell division protein ZapD [Undibacterium rugosum]